MEFFKLLIERGIIDLLGFMAVAIGGVAMAACGTRHHKPLTMIFGISIASDFLLGTVVNCIEIPRVSIMLWLLLVVSPVVCDA